MLFNSKEFVLFLTIIFILFWFVASKNRKAQNTLLLLASYFFYSCWAPRFLIILIFSTLLNYLLAVQISKTSYYRKHWFWICILMNLGFLGIFKYNDFFVQSFGVFVSNLGFGINSSTLKVMLPIGISFYTFHGLSYVIDVYKKRINPEKNIIDYAVFVGFFPLLVAGPIERATHLLPQLKEKKIFNYNEAVDGLRQILWGLFKKVVVADNCAHYADLIFDHSADYSGSTLAIGAVLFSFQIYGDFSGYSDIAIGTARLFGISLLKNFSFPYFSRDIAEFWRRWHISLTTWFRDYLYIPLGGSRVGTLKKIRNIFIVFIVSGMWHGSNWTFVTWGALNAVLFIPLLLARTNRNHLDIVAEGRRWPSLSDVLKMLFTFGLTLICWVFFRAETIGHALSYLSEIFSSSLLTIPEINTIDVFLLIFFFIIVEWFGREGNYAIETLGLKWIKPFRYAFYYALVLAILLYSGSDQQFIYFQF